MFTVHLCHVIVSFNIVIQFTDLLVGHLKESFKMVRELTESCPYCMNIPLHRGELFLARVILFLR